MNTKPIIGRFSNEQINFARTLPDYAKKVPWAHDIKAARNAREEAKHWLVILGLVAAVAVVWFVLPWGGR
jgi:hypothetical protein